MKHLTAIIHLTNDCNLGCKYCYTGSALLNLSKKKSINSKFEKSLPTLYKFLDELNEYNGGIETKLIFHGGEPLLISIQNLNKVISYIKRKHYPFTYGIQTNGSLITDKHIEFFIDNKFEIGISLDGNKELNDRTRVNKNGSSAFQSIFNNMIKLKEKGLNFGVLVTLNKYNFNEIEQIYSFFKRYNIPFSIRPIFQTSFFENGNFQITPKEYGEAFCKLFDLWFYDNEIPFNFINEFSSIMAQFTEPIEGLVSCNFTKKCPEHFVSFNLDGSILPCNRFYGEESFEYGNIKQNTLTNITSCELSKSLSKRWEKLSTTECANCEIKDFCYGGCPANSYYFKNDYYAKDYYCDAYKMIFQHVNNRIAETISTDK